MLILRDRYLPDITDILCSCGPAACRCPGSALGNGDTRVFTKTRRITTVGSRMRRRSSANHVAGGGEPRMAGSQRHPSHNAAGLYCVAFWRRWNFEAGQPTAVVSSIHTSTRGGAAVCPLCGRQRCDRGDGTQSPSHYPWTGSSTPEQASGGGVLLPSKHVPPSTSCRPHAPAPALRCHWRSR